MVKRKKQKISNLDATLRNFLSYMLDNVDRLSVELPGEYSLVEKREFIYNCSVNTILEFIQLGRTHIIPVVSSHRLMKLFKENWLLQQFHPPTINPERSRLTTEIINMFAALKLPLSDQDKNDVMSDVNKLITSTI